MIPKTNSPRPEVIRAAPTEANDPFEQLAEHYRSVRSRSHLLCELLEPEDFVLQSMPDASPAKWHLAHTTWFFETFVLTPHVSTYRPFNEFYCYLFNSYYNAVGERHPRPRRGLLSRPPIRDIFKYRAHVDEAVAELCQRLHNDKPLARQVMPLLRLGLHHEQQHQELILTDLKHGLACNPLRPAYQAQPDDPASEPINSRWISFPEGVRWVGFEGEGFAYDNESPRHRQFLQGFRIASRPTTNGEFREFVESGGYQDPDHWLSDGWDTVQQQGWTAPLYWEPHSDGWQTFTLAGMKPLNPAEPVCHLSYYEADAYARWAGARLPSEAEWETAADVAISGNFLESGRFHPAPAIPGLETEPLQMFGDIWEWTSSAYLPYPGFRAAPGAVGEYNGKFMCNQYVLRGGSCVTSATHIRPTYRNFFYADARWQFSGLRLAKDV